MSSIAEAARCNPERGLNKLVSFDGSTQQFAELCRPGDDSFFKAESFPTPAIARGAGLSYTAASFAANVHSIDHGALNKIIDFNQAEHWIEIQAGASLGQLYDFLIDKKLFLATQPGHPRISVGGCIAPDIHGKNQFLDGTFMNQVISLKLFHPAHGVIELDRQKQPDLFRLTCGAYGLTGNIISCKLNLKKIPSAYADVTLRPLNSIEETLPKLKESAKTADFVLTWHDFTLKGKSFGKGFIQEGRFKDQGSDIIHAANGKKAAEQTLDAISRGSFLIPVFNSLSIKLMNIMYGARCGSNGSQTSMTLFDSIFPIQNSKELYFKFFGTKGFHEYQVVLPEESFLHYIEGVKDYLCKHPIPITLASGKLFAGEQDLLRFSSNGICFALNFARSGSSYEFLRFLDKLLLQCKGIPNIIKDSRLSVETVAACYPEYEKFRKALRDFDPQRVYKSELSERLAL